MSGAPPLEPFGLVLHHDGSWTHEGEPVTNVKLRERFDRAVRYLPDEAKYVVQIAHFRAEIEVEEAGFFVRLFDPDTGELRLSDLTAEALDVSTLSLSRRDGALMCRVKHDLASSGLEARFLHAAHSEFMNAVGEGGGFVVIAGASHPFRL